MNVQRSESLARVSRVLAVNPERPLTSRQIASAASVSLRTTQRHLACLQAVKVGLSRASSWVALCTEQEPKP
jgi:transcriptional regulator GlxA family with amidase domain